MTIIDVNQEEDMSPMSLFQNIFFDFLFHRSPAKTKDQILLKRVYFDPDKQIYLFRSKDFNEFLFINKNFRYFGPVEIHGILKDMKVNTERVRTESGKQLRVLSLSSVHISDEVKLENNIDFEPNFDIEEGEF